MHPPWTILIPFLVVTRALQHPGNCTARDAVRLPVQDAADAQPMQDLIPYWQNTGAASDGLHNRLSGVFWWAWNSNAGAHTGAVRPVPTLVIAPSGPAGPSTTLQADFAAAATTAFVRHDANRVARRQLLYIISLMLCMQRNPLISGKSVLPQHAAQSLIRERACAARRAEPGPGAELGAG